MVENVGESERESERNGVTGGSLAKMGGQVALASTVSRITGFVRTLALAAVLGVALVSDAYKRGQQLPEHGLSAPPRRDSRQRPCFRI